MCDRGAIATREQGATRPTTREPREATREPRDGDHRDDMRDGHGSRHAAAAPPRMVDREASPSHFERVRPDEPWRFACPECDSISVDSLEKARVRHGHDAFSFYCRGCSQKLEYVLDRKTGGRVYDARSEPEE